MNETKQHYKMYKSGRSWIFAAITMVTIGIGGLMGSQVSAAADDTVPVATAVKSNLADNTQASNSVTANNIDNSGNTDNSSQATDVATDGSEQAASESNQTEKQADEPVAATVVTSQPKAADQGSVAATSATQWTSTAQVSLPGAAWNKGDNTLVAGANSDAVVTSQAGLDVKNASNFNIDYNVTNTSNEPSRIQPDFLFPKFFNESTSALVNDNFNLQDLMGSQPGLNYTFSVKPGEYLSYNDLLVNYPDFKPSQLLGIYVQGSSFVGNASYTLSVPLTIANAGSLDTASPENDFEADIYNFNLQQGTAANISTLEFKLVKNTATTIQYLDEDENNKLVQTIPLSGMEGESTDYTVSAPANYDLKSGTPTQGTYNFVAGENPSVIVYLTHQVKMTTETTNRIVNYYIEGTTTALKQATTQTINWVVKTDRVAGDSYATAQGAYSFVSAPQIDGYTATSSGAPATYPAPIAASELADSTATIYYQPNAVVGPNGGQDNGGTVSDTENSNTDTDTTADTGAGQNSDRTDTISITNDSISTSGNGDTVNQSQTPDSQQSTQNDGTTNTSRQGSGVASTRIEGATTGNSNSKSGKVVLADSTSRTGTQKLPQTSEVNSKTGALMGVIMLSILSVLGLAKRRKPESK
ncbi:KxYKxGKxW signal peptide domain-containing protein [Lactobacillus sp. LC28-10]|uniref:KxYKxGKxW signal peptide domain-containing protein n=1 Tax=Secundilactobacillus angelensis TaxID=2722706 RepID=A0ABX1KXD7_9LACO|nr:KxYKxGKxW signal peptide domain-containing protein [Secundilactobacillus angelensis]MCH5461367.1 KxYKxGKxW signal peptide domain-containing protein [Secundilactobacillus angelensis]NLR17820.1 KxYKxGKxW signal peptide domain-containing protein [Secundilactobacillus angelensis]